MSGRALAERSEPWPIRRSKVLYMSGYADDAIVHHGTLDPGTQFISKPFGAADLARKVREVLDSGAPSSVDGFIEAPVATREGAEPPLGESLLALPPDVLDRLWEAVVAARYDEIMTLIETIRTSDPQIASRLAQKAESFDYDGLRRLLMA